MGTADEEIMTVPILELRPTQITVGAREVQRKRDAWQKKTPRQETRYLARHLVPVVHGPGNALFLLDHHHLALALTREGQEEILVSTVADLAHLGADEFFHYMDKRGWLHPFDEYGRRRPVDALPKTVEGLIDDPFRSLAGELREAGGFAKESLPFAEFMWADYLRYRIDSGLVVENPQKALAQAWHLAKSSDCAFLPGWCGP